MKIVSALQNLLIVLTICAIIYGIMATSKLIYSVVGLSVFIIWLALVFLSEILKPQIEKVKRVKINLSFIKTPVMRAIARLF